MIFVDSHVHVHRCFDLASVLSAAASNFEAAARLYGQHQYQSVLCMTETSEAACFADLRTHASSGQPLRAGNGQWSIGATAEDESVMARNGSGRALAVIAGSQIVTAERLEVLALGTAQRFSDGSPIDEVLEAVQDAGAVAVVPWGFGKWLGARGKVVARLVESGEEKKLFLGDNGNRLRGTPEPSLFSLAWRHGLGVLPGSDPLPFRGEERRVGSYGFVLEGALDDAMPARELRDRLRSVPCPVRAYGSREHPVRFLRNQVAMQVVKRLGY
jgi:hypothetical protein